MRDIIAIDIGNTTTVIARADACGAWNRRILSTTGISQAEVERCLQDMYAADTALANRNPPPGHTGIASVVPEATAVLRAALESSGARDVLVVDPARHHIIDHDLETPHSTGVDRLLAARGALEILGKGAALLVVQAGTALTVDLVDAGGCFRGGVIMPGPGIWLQALGRAARLPVLDPHAVEWLAVGPGRCTRDAISQGLVLGSVGALERSARYLSPESHDGDKRMVVTGGWAGNILPLLEIPATHLPDLVLHGLRSVLEAGDYS